MKKWINDNNIVTVTTVGKELTIAAGFAATGIGLPIAGIVAFSIFVGVLTSSIGVT